MTPRASIETTRGSRWKARSPITLLPPWSRSSTGVKLRSTPQARSSAASTWPVARAASSARMAPVPGPPSPSSIHISPSDAHRRQRREAVAAEALDAAALVVDADEQVVADRLHLGDQLGQLKAVAPVAREQDDPAGERMGETAAIVGVEAEAGDVEDDRRVGEVHRADSCSTTTKLAA